MQTDGQTTMTYNPRVTTVNKRTHSPIPPSHSFLYPTFSSPHSFVVVSIVVLKMIQPTLTHPFRSETARAHTHTSSLSLSLLFANPYMYFHALQARGRMYSVIKRARREDEA
jgi:hypothetical protein